MARHEQLIMESFRSYWRARLTFLDVHYHAAPDAFERRHGVIETGRRYRSLGGAVVLKNHLGGSVSSAEAARAEGLPVFGSIVLNVGAGGPAWRVVARELARVQSPWSGRLLVHLPTFTGDRHASRLKRNHSNRYVEEHGLAPCAISDDRGDLTPNVLDVLRMARDHPIVVSTGHASREQVLRLIDAAARFGLDRMMLNQPANPMAGLAARDLLELARHPWLYFEQTALTYLLEYQSFGDFVEVLSNVPNVIYSSDLGQTSQMDVEEWRATSLQWFAELSLPENRVNEIVLERPLAMLAP